MPDRCNALTSVNDLRCCNKALKGSLYCQVHFFWTQMSNSERTVRIERHKRRWDKYKNPWYPWYRS